jgi:hypothetical protein
MFRNIDMRGKNLVEAGVLKTSDLDGWLRASKSPKWRIVGCGLPAYCCLHTLLESAKANSSVRLSPFLDSLKPLWTFAEHMNAQFGSGGCIRRLRSCGILISESGVCIGIG